MSIKQKRIIYKVFQHIHIIGGLFGSLYLLIVGVSTLNFQHHFLPEEAVDTVKYNVQVDFDSTLKADSLAKYITAELGIKGHTPRWDFRQDSAGRFDFKIHRPARSYDVHVMRGEPTVKVDEIHYSIGRILAALHKGSIGELKDIFLITWSWYSQLAGLLILLVIFSSIYFWIKKSIKTKRQWLIAFAVGVFSIIYILFIWLIG